MKRRAARAIVTAAFAATVLLGASACGFNVQTLAQYTQAEGVNVDSQTDPKTDAPLVKVRNLLVISNEDGQGFMSGAMFGYVNAEDDSLTDVAVATVAPDGSPGTPFEVDMPAPIEVPSGGMSQMFGEEAITVTGDELRAGFTVHVTLTFENAGEVTTRVVVIDGNKPDFATIQPPAAS